MAQPRIEAPVVPKLNLDDIEEFSALEFKHRLSMCQPKKPLLETIAEEPVCCRNSGGTEEQLRKECQGRA